MDDTIDIKALRLRLGISQRDLSERLGVDRSTVSRMEHGAVITGPIRLLLRQMVDGGNVHASEHATPAPASSAPVSETVNAEDGA